MGEGKQPHLNGAYYGFSIPSPSKSYHHPRRGGGGGGACGLCSCFCGCIFNLIFQIILTIVIIIGLVVLIFWLLFRPNNVKFHVTDATLTQFDHSANNTLYYNLPLNMTTRNPNRRIRIYYDRIEARASYEGESFATTTVPRFSQGHKTTNTLNPIFQGQHLVVLGTNEFSKYNSERDSGTYSIDVKLHLRVRLKLGVIKTPRMRPKIGCDLRIPLDSNGRSSCTFETTRFMSCNNCYPEFHKRSP